MSLTKEEHSELIKLISYQDNPNRYMSQEEYDRLKELRLKRYEQTN